MSGIYLHFSTDHRTEQEESGFLNRLVRQAIHLERDQIDSFVSSNCSGAVVHHGTVRSSGLSQWRSSEYRLMLCGSCWSEDSEVLITPDQVLKRIIDSGFNEKPSLRGWYSFAFFDFVSKTLTVETDLFGIYPIYYCQADSEYLLVSSEIKALTGFIPRKVNLEALAEMLCFGYMVSDLTFMDSIFRIPPGHRLIWQNGLLHFQKLRRPYFSRNVGADENLLAELKGTFELAMLRYKNESKKICVSLSGGLDSRIAAIVAKNLGFSVHALSMGEPGSLECRIAGEFAEKCEIPILVHAYDGSDFTKWFEQAVWVTEGRCSPGHMHFLDGMLKGKYPSKLMLHGLGGDTVIGGGFDTDAKVFDDISEAKHLLLDSMASFVYWPGESLSEICSDELQDYIREVKERVSESIFERIGFIGSYSDYLWFRYHFRAFGFINPCLVSQITPWTDPIFPYLDPDFFEVCSSIERENIMDRKLQVQWALKYYDKVSTIPRVKDGVLIPIDRYDPDTCAKAYRTLQRKNHLKYLFCRLSGGRINFRVLESYPYYDQWFRRWPSIREFVQQIILSDTSLSRGLWKKKGLSKLIHNLRIGRNVWSALSTILLIEILLRKFHDENSLDGNILREYHLTDEL